MKKKKKCACGETRPEAFSAASIRCRTCRRAYYERNRERLLEYQAAYTDENRKTLYRKNRLRYKTDASFRERLLAYASQYYRDHREEILAKQRERANARYKSDPEFRARRLAQSRACKRRKRRGSA